MNSLFFLQTIISVIVRFNILYEIIFFFHFRLSHFIFAAFHP